jgi:ribonuclease PH
VVASVLGPRPCRTARLEDSERCQLEVVVTPLGGTAGPAEAELCALLRQALAACLVLGAHPRKVLTIAVHVLADDGGAAAAAVNAAVLALADAGVPMRALASAVTLGVRSSSSASSSSSSSSSSSAAAVQLDLTREEAAAASATALAVFSAETPEAPLAVLTAGPLPLAALQRALAVGGHAAAAVLAFQRGALREKVQRDASAHFQSLLGVSAEALGGVGAAVAKG